jgi:hypothetical protein
MIRSKEYKVQSSEFGVNKSLAQHYGGLPGSRYSTHMNVTEKQNVIIITDLSVDS